MITLYSHPMSQFSQRVLIALREKNVSWETVEVAMGEGAHKKPEYLRIHPYGKVPALTVDGSSVYESTAILELLEELHPSPALMPEGPAERARVRMHMAGCDQYFTPQAGTIVFPKRFLPEGKWRRDAMDAAKKRIEQHLAVLDQQLGDQPHLCGEAFTLADVCYAPWLQFLPLTEVEVPANVDRWARSVFRRPSLQATRPPDAPAWPS